MRTAPIASLPKVTRRNFLGRAGVLASAVASAPYSVQLSGAQQEKQKGPKIYALWDLDGCSGIFTREQCWWWEPGVRESVAKEARGIMTADVNAGSAALLAAGVSELIVCDTHHGGGNLFADQMLQDPRITYQHHRLGVEDGKRRWMVGLNETVTGFMLPGHHAKAGTPGAFLPHTWTFSWADFQINGQSVGEMGIEACFAGHWDIPVIFASGDETACAEARQLFPWIVTSVVKWGTSWRESCNGMDLESAHRQTGVKMKEALEKLKRGECRPYKPALPMTVRVQMATIELAVKAAQLPGVLRIDDHTVETRVGRQCDIVKWLLGDGLDMPPKA